MGFDDNAAFRQKEIFSMRDATQEDPRWDADLCTTKMLIKAQLGRSLKCYSLPLRTFQASAAAPRTRLMLHTGKSRQASST